MSYSNQLITIGTYALDDKWITKYDSSVDPISLNKWTDLDGVEHTEYSSKKKLNVKLSLCDMPETCFENIRAIIGSANVVSVTAWVGDIGNYVTQDCDVTKNALPVTYTKNDVVYGSIGLQFKGRGGSV